MSSRKPQPAPVKTPEPASTPVNRKPQPQATREPAQIVLNRFLKEQGILIGTSRPKIDFTNSGAMIIEAPGIIAAYANALPNGTNNSN